MKTITIISIIGMVISFTATTIIFYNFCKTNNFFGLISNRRINRISPETFQILARIIQQRNEQIINEYQYNRDREIEMIEYNKRDKIIIINPNNNIEIGIGKKTIN